MSTDERAREERASEGGRVLAIVLLTLASAAQVLFGLVAVVALGLGGASGAEAAVLLGAAIAVLFLLVALLVVVVRRRWRPRAAWLALAAPVVDVVAIVAVSTGAFGGSCSEQELRTIDEIPPYSGAPLAWDHDVATGSCAAVLEVSATADDVLDHYERELEADGWSVTIEDVPTGSEGTEPVVVKDLRARRGSESFTIALESYSGTVSAAIRVDPEAFEGTS